MLFFDIFNKGCAKIVAIIIFIKQFYTETPIKTVAENNCKCQFKLHVHGYASDIQKCVCNKYIQPANWGQFLAFFPLQSITKGFTFTTKWTLSNILIFQSFFFHANTKRPDLQAHAARIERQIYLKCRTNIITTYFQWDAWKRCI